MYVALIPSICHEDNLEVLVSPLNISSVFQSFLFIQVLYFLNYVNNKFGKGMVKCVQLCIFIF